MPFSRRSILTAGAAVGYLLWAASPSAAQDSYPSKPIRIVVPYAAGGSTDQLARAIQQPMQEFLKQPVVIDNKVGAGGAIGTESVVKSAPDGYTLVFGNSGPNSILPLLRKTPYDPLKDLRPISTVAITPMILAVSAGSSAKNLKEFMALAKKSGTDWNFGSVGNGSLSHLTGEYFNALSGLKLQHVPYNGGAPMMTAFAGGQLQAAFVTGLDGAAMVAAGRVKYLAVGTPKRTDVVPGLPAIAEEVPGFRSVAWFGVLAPSGVPDAVAAKLHEAVVFATSRPEVRKMFSDRMIEARSSTPQELDRMIRDEMAQWGEVAKRSNIRLD
ncbi:tripartite tricarboxylate transporter substrate binding protein [Variovorax sp. J31P207]|uniref:Bug family tripartite tricarboxylate transporter substrate binding protein n=1 Tax=Variovorax sp. J31P207 TaxID=3053510 RepID=UPI00257608A6|nr:tripartite tricarboxylate transporter substrate binding protein [Variovorax sp. J31P207]MDM0066847.1 tripartite tricarboxylate transporter substrate binding protein [Variovorax sp. J31P207]